MNTKFKSFEEFGKAAQQEQSLDLKQEINSIFEKSIKEDFESIPEGPFKSSLPEIDWIAFARPTDRKTGERNTSSLNAVIFSKTESGKPVNHIWTISKDGNIKPIQPIPSELTNKYSQEQIALEIVQLLELINPSFIHITEMDVIPEQDPGESREVAVQGPPGPPKVIDPRRKHFMQTLRGVEFQFANEDKQFRGYQGFLFNTFIYLENPVKDNAAFIMDLPEKVDIDGVEGELAKEKLNKGEESISKKELREAILRRYWGPISEKAKTRKELVALGAKKIIHAPGPWEENIRHEIEKRTIGDSQEKPELTP